MKKITIIALIVAVSTFAFALDGFCEQKPKYGGILKVIRPTFPKVIGYPNEFTPVESICALIIASIVVRIALILITGGEIRI